MSRYVEFELPDGGVVILESDEPADEREEAASPLRGDKGMQELAYRPFSVRGEKGEVTERARQTFEEAAENARRAAVVVLDKLRRGLVDPPDEVEITFGLKASGELGTMVVAKAGAEASYSVTLKWKKAEANKA